MPHIPQMSPSQPETRTATPSVKQDQPTPVRSFGVKQLSFKDHNADPDYVFRRLFGKEPEDDVFRDLVPTRDW